MSAINDLIIINYILKLEIQHVSSEIIKYFSRKFFKIIQTEILIETSANALALPRANYSIIKKKTQS